MKVELAILCVFLLTFVLGWRFIRSRNRKQSMSTNPNVTSSSSESPPFTRPWIRYWARLFDLYVFNFVCGLFLGIVVPRFVETTNEIVLSMILCFAWIFVEALILSSFQTTPGKWLFKINLKATSGAQINFSQALTRSLKVWWRGLGTGFPFASLITLIIAHNNLKKEGITSWDRDGNLTVNHAELSIPRVLVAIGFFVLFLILIAASR